MISELEKILANILPKSLILHMGKPKISKVKWSDKSIQIINGGTKVKSNVEQ